MTIMTMDDDRVYTIVMLQAHDLEGFFGRMTMLTIISFMKGEEFELAFFPLRKFASSTAAFQAVVLGSDRQRSVGAAMVSRERRAWGLRDQLFSRLVSVSAQLFSSVMSMLVVPRQASPLSRLEPLA